MKWVLAAALLFAALRYGRGDLHSPFTVVIAGALLFAVLSSTVYFLTVFLPRRICGFRENIRNIDEDL